MDIRYQKWISEHYPDADAARYQCQSATTYMVACFPELVRVRGWYGAIEHWWCKTKAGEIVDPTASQFTCQLPYKEFREGVDPEPIGKCMFCGEYCWKSNPKANSCCCGRRSCVEEANNMW